MNYVLIEFIDFKKYERKIDQNVFRSIIRVKRIYRIFYYRKILSENALRSRQSFDDLFQIFFILIFVYFEENALRSKSLMNANRSKFIQFFHYNDDK